MIQLSQKQFLISFLIYTFIAHFFAVLLANPIVIFNFFLSLIIAWTIKHYYTSPVKELENVYRIFFLMLAFCVIPIFSEYDEMTDVYVTDKSQLQQVTAVVPKTYEQTSGKYYTRWLPFANHSLHCDSYYKDSCDDIYQYAGETATIWYQDNLADGSIIYEVQIDNAQHSKPYEFHKQRTTFLKKQRTTRLSLLCAFVIYFFPLLFFAWQDRKIRQNFPSNLPRIKYQYNKNSLVVTVCCIILFLVIFVMAGLFFVIFYTLVKRSVVLALILSYINALFGLFLAFISSKTATRIYVYDE